MNRSMWIAVSLILVLSLGAFSPALAARWTWQGDESTDWGLAGNWDTNSVPVSGPHEVWIRNNVGPNSPTYSAAQGTTHLYLLANGCWGQPGTDLNITGGELYVDLRTDGTTWDGVPKPATNHPQLYLGNAGGTSTINISGGLLQVSGPGGYTRVGVGAGNTGIINISGSGIFKITDNLELGVVAGSQGIINIAGGQLIVDPLIPGHGLEFDVAGSTGGVVNFLPGSTGSWTYTGKDYSYFLGLYTGDDLTYDGGNSLPFDEVFRVSGSTFSLLPTSTVIPEPSTFLLAAVGLFGLAFFARRRRERRCHHLRC